VTSRTLGNVSIEELRKRFESTRWRQFLSNFFGNDYMMWHDGYDPDAILNLTDEEKQVAEEMLLKSIPLNGMWSAAGLALLRSQKAVAVMKEQFARTHTNLVKIRLADAIMQIIRGEEYIPVLIGCLQNAAFWSDRAEAARELRKYPLPGVIQALFIMLFSTIFERTSRK